MENKLKSGNFIKNIVIEDLKTRLVSLFTKHLKEKY